MVKKSTSIIPVERIENKILLIRGQKIIIDSDMADLYGVSTKRLNEQVKRNEDRFPADFMFQLTKQEKGEVVANCDHLGKLKFSPNLPYAFTEHGAIMAASVLNSQRAVEVIQAFKQIGVIPGIRQKSTVITSGVYSVVINKQFALARFLLRPYNTAYHVWYFKWIGLQMFLEI